MKIFCFGSIIFSFILYHVTAAAPPLENNKIEGPTQNEDDQLQTNDTAGPKQNDEDTKQAAEIAPENDISQIKVLEVPNNDINTAIDIPKPVVESPGLIVRIYRYTAEYIIKIIKDPKINQVLRDIGTCFVNGAMEIISFYFPTPLMPLLATAAGLIIPFEPVVMLKQRMPVTSYRRAFQTAMKTFVGTFDKYKPEDEFDPYMTKRFNRRFMGSDKDTGKISTAPKKYKGQ